MNRRSPRGLNPEEKDLWDRVARTTRPLEGRSPSGALISPVSKVPAAAAPEKKAFAPFEVGSKSVSKVPASRTLPSVGSALDAAPLRMDQKQFGRMKRGKSKPEARIDLHGMRISEAHGALNAFILSSLAKERRLVLVITGKGRISDDDGPIPVRRGVLRHQVPVWLSRPPLSSAVLQVTEAHQRHGGSGAFYVYLRRR